MEFCDLRRQYQLLKKSIDFNIQNVLTSGKFINGQEVRLIEEKCSTFVGVKHAIGTSSGTDALLVALMAYGVQKGDYVITTPFTFIATAEVISLVGAKPLFVDICPKTYNIDSEKINELMKDAISRNIKGIIVVDIFGQPADYDAIRKIAKQHDLFVIEDAAQSFGAEYKGRKACSLGDISTTSFFPSKPLGCYGDGGMIFTNNDELAYKMRKMINHGQSKKYEHELIGTNARLDTLQAAILLAKFDNYIQGGVERRNNVARMYTERLSGKTEIILPFVEPFCKSSWAQYAIQTDKRETIINHLEKSGIQTAIHYPKPLHLQKAFSELGYKQGDFPVAEELSKKILSLPMDELKTEQEISFVCEKIKEIIK